MVNGHLLTAHKRRSLDLSSRNIYIITVAQKKAVRYRVERQSIVGTSEIGMSTQWTLFRENLVDTQHRHRNVRQMPSLMQLKLSKTQVGTAERTGNFHCIWRVHNSKQKQKTLHFTSTKGASVGEQNRPQLESKVQQK